MFKLIASTLVAVLLSFFVVDNLRLQPTNGNATDVVTFTIKNFGVNVDGNISGVKGSIDWNAADVTKTTVQLTADVNTINTGIKKRDDHLKKDDFFDVQKHPELTFKSTKVTSMATGGFMAEGNLTIKGITKPVTIPFNVGIAGNQYTFKGEFTIDRRGFEVGGSSMTMGDNVKVVFNIIAAAK